MDTLTFPKNVLIKKVSANRDRHEKTYAEAMEGFRRQALSVLSEKLCELEEYGEDWNGDLQHGRSGLYVSVPGPEYHGDDYERVESMLRMTDQESITLNEEQFAKYVMDEWDWKESFHMSTTAYLNR